MNQKEHICMKISELAIKSLLYEVSATPKPGLVDRNNSGAHKDMDFYTFMTSSAALPFVFHACAEVGYEFSRQELSGMLQALRPIGIEGERRMFEATAGINTHKGLIFSLSIISAAAGYIVSNMGTESLDHLHICEAAAKIAYGVTENDFKDLEKKQKLTYGERLYKEFGIRGIRGEVEAGFPTVLQSGYPILRKYMKAEGCTINDALVHTLLNLMKDTEDSNVLGRHGLEALSYVKQRAAEVLAKGSIFTQGGKKEIEALDKEFIQKNISPGGSADLLAIAIMLYFLEENL